jgi:hypothetical protein
MSVKHCLVVVSPVKNWLSGNLTSRRSINGFLSVFPHLLVDVGDSRCELSECNAVGTFVSFRENRRRECRAFAVCVNQMTFMRLL